MIDKKKEYELEDIKGLYQKLLIKNVPGIKNEEDLKIHFTGEIKNFFDDNNLVLTWSFEHQLESKKKLDILVNNRTIIELKKPNYFSLQSNIDKTRKKIEEEYIDKKEQAERINAIFYDGCKIGFYENQKFIGIFPLNENSVKKLTYLILNDDKKVFNSENLISDFQKTKSLDNFARQLFFILENSQVLNKIKILFSEWKRLFNLSETDRNRSEDYLKKVRSLSDFFGVEISENENERINKSLFSLQTAFAFCLKIISLKSLEKKFSFNDPINLKNISLSSPNELRKFLENLEYGRVHKDNYNIVNFFEGDFFGWYVEVFEKCENEIRKIIEQISEYENINYKDNDIIATHFFIDLYRYFIPFEVRHSLGEYYTPKWLVDLVIEETLKHNKNKSSVKVLDPACGSGIFLTSYIKKLIEEKKELTSQDFTNNIFGIDLNPIAVLQARINYLLAIRNYYQKEEIIEIPVYLSDSIYQPQFIHINRRKYFYYQLDTQIGEIIDIYLPMEVNLSDDFFGKLARNIRDKVKNTAEIFREDLGITSEEELNYLEKMTLQLIELNERKWNGIWINIIKQFYKASQIENIDLVIGNPPWISWTDLPENYRNRIKLLKNVKSIFGVSRNIGGNNLNVCALMANVVASRKLNQQTGCLGFIMPKSLLFNASYEGFRPFILENSKRLYLQKYFNFDRVKKPFEEANLKFGVYFYSSQETKYQKGVEQVIFSSKEKLQNRESNLLVSIQENTNTFSVVDNKEELENFKLIQGAFTYKFRTGVGVTRKDICRFFYSKNYSSSTSLFTRNQKGKKIKQSKNLPSSIELENKVMYPYVTTSNIFPFKNENQEIEWTFFPYDIHKKSKQPLAIDKIINNWPKLSDYIHQIRQLLKSKSQYSQRVQNVSENYGLLRVGKYTYAEHFVSCRDNTKWVASYFKKIITPWQEEKIPLFDSHIKYISQDKEGNFISRDEAYYITAILNAPVVKKFIEATNVERNYSFDKLSIFVPKYDEKNKLSLALKNVASSLIELKKDFDYSLAEKLNELYLQFCRR
jgi:hypothetical protein